VVNLPLTEQEARAVLHAGGYGGGLVDHDAYLAAMVRLQDLVRGKRTPIVPRRKEGG
jgi:hypothetical protein